MHPITIKLPEHLRRLLDELVREHGSTRSAVLREALEAYAGRRRPSVTATAGDLVGSLEGPRDLSTSPRHMQGFGE
jgi:metal-responsive CopG/Arc/MetJ family transcriptional regulator